MVTNSYLLAAPAAALDGLSTPLDLPPLKWSKFHQETDYHNTCSTLHWLCRFCTQDPKKKVTRKQARRSKLTTSEFHSANFFKSSLLLLTGASIYARPCLDTDITMLRRVNCFSHSSSRPAFLIEISSYNAGCRPQLRRELRCRKVLLGEEVMQTTSLNTLVCGRSCIAAAAAVFGNYSFPGRSQA
jgi:hypothetical protein